jgi:protease I
MENTGTIKIDLFIDEVKAVDYDAVVIPGGAWNPDSLRMDKAKKRLTQSVTDHGFLTMPG